ncbi:MAG: hypothetical protein M1840_005601 [Geoglossum simile]|nr:MAG: hypothetical protein M1840_005601 [Geoglossum simile]
MSPLLQSANGVAPKGRQRINRAIGTLSSQNVLLFIVALRIVNALSMQTFFQPDEYFQSLEPAWQIVFGEESGAWITWEWKHRLRSSIHPAAFAAVYCISSNLASLLGLSTWARAELLLAAPKVAQAVIAALGDYYTWKLGERVYGQGSRTAWATWFCATRTLSNCLETTLTVAALNLWPWHWSLAASKHDKRDDVGLRVPRTAYIAWPVDELARLRRALLLAALACVLRPTNALIWICVSLPLLFHASGKERFVLFREVIICGSLILALSCLTDRLYYQTWTFTPFRFLYFNIVQSLSIFYGRNDWHYYVSQGFPLLLTTTLPFGLLGVWRTLSGGYFISLQLAITVLFVTLTLSLISHKEVRFIYPVLPALHIIAAEALVTTICPSLRTHPSPLHNRATPSARKLWKFILPILMAINILIALYTSLIHQSGVTSVLTYLRKEHESRNANTTIGFLMPCHSTPWRSHLVHPTIHAWALTCEPPVNLSPEARETYLDEADIFYTDPSLFLRTHFAPPPLPGEKTQRLAGKRQWPDYIVFFEQLQSVMVGVLEGSGYVECWRGFNTHWHDDWRRKGDVIVWCLKAS